MRQLLFWREALWLYHRDAANDRHTFGFKDAYGYKEAYDYKEADYDPENTDHISENPHFLFGRLDLQGRHNEVNDYNDDFGQDWGYFTGRAVYGDGSGSTSYYYIVDEEESLTKSIIRKTSPKTWAGLFSAISFGKLHSKRNFAKLKSWEISRIAL